MSKEPDIIFIEYDVSQMREPPIEKGALPLPASIRKSFNVSAEVISGRFAEFFRGLSHTIGGVPKELAGYEVDSIELSLEFDVKLGFQIVAKAESGLVSGIKVVLKRSQTERAE